MRDRQEDKLSMYLAVRKVLAKFNAIWSPLAAFVTVVADYDAVIAAIQGDRQTQEKDTKGVTQDKQAAKDKLIIKVMEVIGAVVAFATETEDNALLEKVNYTESELRNKTRDTILVDKCQLVHDEADAVIGSLAGHGILPADLSALQGLIDDYEDLVPAPRVAIGDRVAATDSLEAHFKEGDKVLEKRMDGLMENFRESEKDFYAEYHNARTIVGRGRRSTNLEVQVVDAGSGMGVPDVALELVAHGESTLTDMEGFGLFETIAPGSDTLRAVKTGWVTKEVLEVEIASGKTSKLVVELSMEPPA